ncbi:AsnC family transcriptional regulator [Celerinatantimonas diazotrophica]|uniref:AsnC family transcriptional regulator n=1 Tax=Celerinatantimonas diazotrophica TaxID=412034 RepID=A0A4R1J9G0_9GAMM|nr:AsnC family transcriptional regulator [Celerinatantimonas diazotrophica]CAG9296017.1 DNA-binding transcriptional activator DecR [Celerinatantimonas diazotrophica]
MELDTKDRLILSILQRDVTLGLQTIAQRVGLSPTPCWRRIQKLEQNGVIRAKVALLDKTQLNLGVTVFVSIKTSSHSQAWLDRFKQLLSDIPEIIEAHRLSGNVDYLLQIVVPDIDRYDVIYKKLIEHLDFADISSAFAMETFKKTTELPTDYRPQDNR